MVEKPDDAPRKTTTTGLVKLTVNLTPKAFSAMEEAAARDGNSKTDVVNRALQLYNLVGRLAVVDNATGVVQILDRDGHPIRIVVL